MEQSNKLISADTLICCLKGEEIIIYALLEACCGPFGT
jgi:hypothetical protein